MMIAILSFFSGVHERGVETWVTNLKKNLRGVDMQIVSGKPGESIFFNALRNFRRWSKADIVVPTNGRLQVLICRLGSWFLGKPIIVFGHSGPGADDKWNLLCSPNIFVAFSDSQKKWAQGHKLPWTKVVKIPHAVDTDVFTPADRKPRAKVVLCVAANTPDKRVDLVKAAIELLPGFKFMGVGEANERSVPFDQMPEIYKEADVFCFVPQPWEAFGLVFLEAMATNLPVVTIDDPVRREIVGNAGVFVKHPRDAKELSQAIKKAYSINWEDKPRVQAEKFSWGKIVKVYEKFFSAF
ncbi:hypothetical protein A2125_00260 [Candidatus Woesebacteria bacterium GWB1_43_5]|uniref:Glycosyl transferase family 1 domain-containing protein n=1 Tax=Candidatus Woesebacteria bacterium GWB1_43_5 TaxID=1802474 RepID=A0A1F7WRS1_9BACT|nr:MAG: hypothetical protein A2125_00260 [Candidatus Woesebacteria bacterium GWB1_43_5]